MLFSVWSLVLIVWSQVPSNGLEARPGPYRVALQLSSADPERQRLTLQLAEQLTRRTGLDVEVVALGPGLKALAAGAVEQDRIDMLARRGVHFQVCAESLRMLDQGHGQAPALLPAAELVPSGVMRLAELAHEGYTVIAP